MITSRNGMSPMQLEPGHDHPVLPEEDDLAGGRVDVARVVAAKLRRLVGPAERRERPERGREPRVEHVLVARRARRAALRARVRRRSRRTSRGRSSQYQIGSWWPHQSWRDTFQGRIDFSQSSATRFVHGRVERDAARLDRLDRGRRHRLHVAPPLQRHERLDARAGAFAVADRMAVALALLELVVVLAASATTRSAASSSVSPT